MKGWVDMGVELQLKSWSGRPRSCLHLRQCIRQHFSTVKKDLRKKIDLKGGNLCFDSQLLRFKRGVLLPCGPVMTVLYSRRLWWCKLFTSWWSENERAKEGWLESKYFLQGHVPGGLASFHLALPIKGFTPPNGKIVCRPSLQRRVFGDFQV